jgi:hypothetical protein
MGAGAALLLAAGIGAAVKSNYVPGTRTVVLAHNAYPDHGKYGDRLDRALAAGTPFVVEEDLAWVDGRSLLIHGAKNASADDPTLENYFFPKVRPVIEKALKEGNKGNWPLITLYLDIKNDPPEHLEAVSKLLDKYDAWLTTAVKTNDIMKQSPLDLKPIMVLVEDKQKDIKHEFFYDRVAVGGKIRVFGSPDKPDGNPNKLPKEQAFARMVNFDPEQLVAQKADNYRRWWGTDWHFIEICGPEHTAWTPAKEARLKKFIDYGHRLGYFVSFYQVDSFTDGENQGWEQEYNFSPREHGMERWNALIKLHADFISTDQYETVAALIRGGR